MLLQLAVTAFEPSSESRSHAVPTPAATAPVSIRTSAAIAVRYARSRAERSASHPMFGHLLFKSDSRAAAMAPVTAPPTKTAPPTPITAQGQTREPSLGLTASDGGATELSSVTCGSGLISSVAAAGGSVEVSAEAGVGSGR